MKSLMVYVSPKKEFPLEESKLVKIQIDNSLELGWKKKDILIFTNFAYEYKGIKTLLVPDDCYCPFRPLSTKTITIVYLMENQLLSLNEIYWVHDFDAYQLEQFTDLNLQGYIAGFTDYGWSKKWSLGSYFVRPSIVLNLFTKLRDEIYETKLEDERVFTNLTESKQVHGYKKLNVTYNFGMRNVVSNYKFADKPLKVVHFHPIVRGRHVLDSFMYGKNQLKKVLMTDRLIKIFKAHGLK